MFLSVISPVYKAEKILHELVRQIETAAMQITDSYEIILVEDNGPDKSREVIKDICLNNPHVKGIFLSRNFGQQYALNAGFDNAEGEWIVTLDCDLQDTPSLIGQLYKKATEGGYDIVYASRQNRQDGFLKMLGSKYFNTFLGWLTDTKQDETIANFVLYKRKVVKAMISMGDYRKYYPLMNHWVGFSTCTEPIPHAGRADKQKSSYSFSRRMRLAINTGVAFSDKLLRLMIFLGLFIVLFASFFALFFIISYFVKKISVSGWTTLFVSIWFVAGIIIILLGIIGVYIGKIYEEVKKRPSYIISEKVNF
jgi:dolichol-phosphate mannosyltransferase